MLTNRASTGNTPAQSSEEQNANDKPQIALEPPQHAFQFSSAQAAKSRENSFVRDTLSAHWLISLSSSGHIEPLLDRAATVLRTLPRGDADSVSVGSTR